MSSHLHPRLLVLLTALGLPACDKKGDGILPPLAITSSAPSSASVNEPFEYQVVVEDAEGVVTITLGAAPTGMTVDDSGLVSWTPTLGDLGAASVTIEATDGTETATQSFDLDVDQGLYMGVGISPRGHTNSSTSDDFIEQYTTPDETGRVIAFFDPWRLDVSDDGELSGLTEAAFVDAESFDFIPLVALKWADGTGVPDLTSESEPLNNSWSNAETRAEFLSVVTEIASNWHPRYLGLGHETNLYYVTHTEDEWADWLSEFEECYDAVKAISPDTIVFTIFQWEIMKNLGTGTVGWDFGQHFALIGDHATGGKIDAIAFTSFPYFEYATPDAILDDHYAEIADYWDGPVLFTEIGWPASSHAPFPGSEIDQRDFIGRFFDLSGEYDLEYVGWTYQHDWDGEAGQPAFASIGLRSNDGSVVRAADSTWATEIGLRERAE